MLSNTIKVMFSLVYVISITMAFLVFTMVCSIDLASVLRGQVIVLPRISYLMPLFNTLATAFIAFFIFMKIVIGKHAFAQRVESFIERKLGK